MFSMVSICQMSVRAAGSRIIVERLVLGTANPLGQELVDQLLASSDPTVFTHHLARLETLGLLERHEDGTLFVPFASIEIILPLARVA